jgi:hypothetical protein
MQKQTRGLLTGARWLLPASALLTFGCPSEELAPIEPCTVSGVFQEVNAQGADKVDMLFMIDNSGSMAEEQALLAAQLPRLAEILASGMLPLPGGEIRKFTPVSSLHLGVISSDIGLSGAVNERAISTCEDAIGDDGKLLVTGNGQCNLTTVQNGNHLNFDKQNNTNPTTLGQEFGCITSLGTTGCGLEQQLESMLKAVTPATNAEFKFTAQSPNGQEDGPNAGFLRTDSVVALVAVTDEEDCSIPDGSNGIFVSATQDARFIASNGKAVGLNARCGVFADTPGVLHDVQRYVKGFQAVRPANPDLVIFGAIAGVPITAETMVDDNGVQDFQAILDMGDMQNRFNGVVGLTDENVEELTNPSATLPDPACVAPPDGRASPARRFVQVAQGFGANGVIRSICNDDFSSALTSIIDKIASKLTGACLKRTLNPNNQGIVECDIVEYLPVGKTPADCLREKGRTLAENGQRRDMDGNTHTVCKINQVAVTKNNGKCNPPVMDATDCLSPNPVPGAPQELVGWYYDDFTQEVQQSCAPDMMMGGQRIGFTVGAEPGNGSKVQFECLQPVFTVGGKPAGKDTVNKTCDGSAFVGQPLTTLWDAPTDSADCTSDKKYPKVRCEPVTNTCQIMCQGDAQCPDSWVCDVREGNLGFCVNPTCPN